MKITRDIFKEAYKTYNILKGYSKQKIEIDLNPKTIKSFLDNYNPSTASEKDKKYFGQLLGILIFEDKTKKRVIPEDTIGYQSFELENLSFNKSMRDEIREEQRYKLLDLIECTPKEVGELDNIDEVGRFNYSDNRKEYSDSELGMELKYKVGFSLSRVFKNITSNTINRVYNAVKEYTNNGKEIFDEYELANNERVKITKSEDIKKFQSDIYNRKQNQGAASKSIQAMKKDRSIQLQAELESKLNLYIATKKAVNENNFFSRYFNPFNWGKTYRENSALSRMEKDFKNNYGFTKDDMDFVNTKVENPEHEYNSNDAQVFIGENRQSGNVLNDFKEYVDQNPKVQVIFKNPPKNKIINEKIMVPEADEAFNEHNSVYDFKQGIEPAKEIDERII